MEKLKTLELKPYTIEFDFRTEYLFAAVSGPKDSLQDIDQLLAGDTRCGKEKAVQKDTCDRRF